ncbi:hypothetical protein C0992_005338 [Termitomyces sp. T32_za158]|nr:hypothetical protein C0992_005338 [Termitomyces sp. T32_za158]
MDDDKNTLGAGVVFRNEVDINGSEKGAGLEQPTEGSGELLAITLALLKSGTRHPLEICTRSEEAAKALTTNLESKEDAGFIGSRNAGLLRTIVGRLRMHAAPVTFRNLKDSPRNRWELEARDLAQESFEKERPMVLPLIPVELHLTGAKLSKMLQARAYRTIKSLKPIQLRPRTEKPQVITRSGGAYDARTSPDKSESSYGRVSMMRALTGLKALWTQLYKRDDGNANARGRKRSGD